MRLGIEGKLFVVTGAAQGIGSAIAKGLVEEGASVAAVDMNAEGLKQLASIPGVHTYVADLSSAEEAHSLCSTVIDDLGPTDGLVTAAGGVRGQAGKALETVSEAEWRVIFAANVDAAMWCAQALAPSMKIKGSGSIVTISSGAGLRPSLTGIQSYAAAKHALVGLTRQLALELGPAGITVNSVAPGFVLSNPSTEKQWKAFGPDRQEQVLNGIHMRRLGYASDIADAVLFLCSDRARWISGQILSVDGGHA